MEVRCTRRHQTGKAGLKPHLTDDGADGGGKPELSALTSVDFTLIHSFRPVGASAAGVANVVVVVDEGGQTPPVRRGGSKSHEENIVGDGHLGTEHGGHEKNLVPSESSQLSYQVF